MKTLRLAVAGVLEGYRNQRNLEGRNMISQRVGRTLVAGAVTMSLLGASAAQAAVVLDPDDATKAIGIEDLSVGGTLYDVAFVGPTEAVNVYGSTPVLDFTTDTDASAAVDAINAALNDAGGVETVGEDDSLGSLSFRVGWEVFGSGLTQAIRVWEGAHESISDPWVNVGEDQLFYNADSRIYADFTAVPVPAAVWLFGSGLLGLIGIARSKQATSL